MKSIYGSLVFLLFSNFSYAEEAVDKLKSLIDMGSQEIQLGCTSRDEARDVFKNISFHRDYCPFVTPKTLKIVQTQGAGDASKGNITYSFDCVLRVREYNYGVMTKTHDDHPHGSVSAEYIFAFGDVAIRNVTATTEEQLCAAPIANKLNALNRK